ncbi:Scr1 family TA system antitoxin-like transcriptional regulator [Saccharopolyspora pogona]|uniref:Scr1 family TA system antitoxin-like transcriptional regulator n=1 Tax=Saccharopolyspora pogona TaxID=333966 RepID=UPI001682E8AC|nr:hypothetical protein [Saccharopolyspora pogona]
MTALGVSATERDRLVEMARDADAPNLTADRSVVRQELTALIEFERTATRITNVATGLIPGLLQTSATRAPGCVASRSARSRSWC